MGDEDVWARAVLVDLDVVSLGVPETLARREWKFVQLSGFGCEDSRWQQVWCSDLKCDGSGDEIVNAVAGQMLDPSFSPDVDDEVMRRQLPEPDRTTPINARDADERA